MIDDIIDDIKNVTLIAMWTFVLCMMFLIPIAAFSYWADKILCFSKYEQYLPEYSAWGGCRVLWNGRLTPVDNIGFREINQHEQ